ncbi:hypothetical protein EK21DRAFT_116280 [Setomelanomma holmii]|uniref:Heterokaryon incompatibility domain-containing protein n=1 Tax=Setomelanomma holmii TaxID=210430 RepID=A0A9P4LJE3_9PLEO|nr:hypothetical protein EK21DRAFT_116280 [Setomelanomma holmii]
MRLIDVDHRRIVLADNIEDPRWIALSYVWGESSPIAHINTIVNGHLPLQMPRTVQDAIIVTKNLGYRYLWKMDQIYKGADLTAVAAAGDNKNNGLPGIGPTLRTNCGSVRLRKGVIFGMGPAPLKELRALTWWTRVWTFQEGYLSQRLLVFTDHQMTFYCNTSSWIEALSGPGPMGKV